MWAYLFWTVVVAWLFTLRPKRDIEDDRQPRPFSTLGNPDTNANGTQHGHCAHTCCHVHAHTHSNGHGMEQTQSPVVQRPNADPEIKTPAREELSWADQSYGTPSERDVSRIHVLGAMLTGRIPLLTQGNIWVDSEETCHRILIARLLVHSRAV